jgi:hypothetical protein
MPRKCTICENPARNEIDKALVDPGAVLRAMARQFNVGRDALRRHVNGGHIAEKIVKAKHAHDAVEADSFIQKIQKKHNRFEEMAKEAKGAKNPYLELKILHEQGRYFDMEGKACGVYREKVEHTGPGGVPLEKTIIILPSNDRDTKKNH